ncbi:ABC transporter permease [Conexibacter sp. JD483]|uniref:ABC transporter permease n=1 Tax=unclassified Conexibacter TaxID=2627773 RepID=UPI0027285CC0|nr:MULTISPECIES: ABC transporter permease [unclassified Conexibacter]MDO8187648.1 ABC transporter permease [Conexibacter sp. CPCC 205706]MDO8199833.1 ABC transporter permease [Conexibacter sp. CPCC 205762]MDR9370210.1 ABC transporter permease [Conexibacter sp. JD483]
MSATMREPLRPAPGPHGGRTAPAPGRGRRAWAALGAAGLRAVAMGLVAFLLLALVGPLLWGKDPLAVDLQSALQGPSGTHPFGTDELGRDVFARFLVGARISLAVGVCAVFCSSVVGTLIGAFTGLVGGPVDAVIGRALDGVLAFPALIMGMALAVAMGPGAVSVGLAIAVTGVPWYARTVRSEVLSLRSREFIDAQRVLGAPTGHILIRHVLPSVLGGVAVQASLGIAYAVLAIAGLGFLGLGIQPPTPEWGGMITEGRTYLISGQWWMSIFPGLGILALVTLSMALGEGLRDHLDPHGKLRR